MDVADWRDIVRHHEVVHPEISMFVSLRPNRVQHLDCISNMLINLVINYLRSLEAESLLFAELVGAHIGHSRARRQKDYSPIDFLLDVVHEILVIQNKGVF